MQRILLALLILIAAAFQSLATVHAADADTRNLRPASTSQGERRIALVIGNGAYRSEDLKPLANPTNDADDVAAALKGFGFEVLAHKNLDRRKMKDAIAEFGRKANNADAALFYFAGHGIQIKNQNYLMPVDAAVRSEADAVDEGVNVNFPLEEMDNAKARVNLVMLDACRNNDFSGKFRSGTSRGLAAPGSVPKGTVIVYATDPGNVASDGTGRNGLFTAGLLAGFKGQDLSLDGVLTTASTLVEERSGGKQMPYVNGPKTVQKNFYFIFQGPATVNVQPQATPSDPETETWRTAERANSEGAYRAYLDGYPKGKYAIAARIAIDALKPSPAKPVDKPAEKPTAAVPPAPTLATPLKPATVTDPETEFWSEVKTSGTKEYVDAYLKQYPKGKFVALARVEQKKIDDKEKADKARVEAERKAAQAREDAERKQLAEREKQERIKAELNQWESAKRENSSAAYTGYLNSYPSGPYSVLAQLAKEKAQREDVEKARQEEERRKQVAEQVRREAEERARQEAARVAEAERKALEEAARGPQWADSDNGADINWNEATRYCASKGSGWRLPTEAELLASYQSGRSTPCGSYSCNVSSNSRLTEPFFWTNDPQGSSEASYVSLATGYRGAYPVGEQYGYRALCVRRP
jgi:uncharacterized caspase-like protein